MKHNINPDLIRKVNVCHSPAIRQRPNFDYYETGLTSEPINSFTEALIDFNYLISIDED